MTYELIPDDCLPPAYVLRQMGVEAVPAETALPPTAQYTRGEWFAEENEGSQGWRVLTARPPSHDSDDLVYYLIADDLTEADAQLLVAAPAILAALRELIPLIAAEYPQQQAVWLTVARAAIARATQRQP